MYTEYLQTSVSALKFQLLPAAVCVCVCACLHGSESTRVLLSLYVHVQFNLI